jgi:hypothetical protein
MTTCSGKPVLDGVVDGVIVWDAVKDCDELCDDVKVCDEVCDALWEVVCDADTEVVCDAVWLRVGLSDDVVVCDVVDACVAERDCDGVDEGLGVGACDCVGEHAVLTAHAAMPLYGLAGVHNPPPSWLDQKA